jgi:hypothetical protein
VSEESVVRESADQRSNPRMKRIKAAYETDESKPSRTKPSQEETVRAIIEMANKGGAGRVPEREREEEDESG